MTLRVTNIDHVTVLVTDVAQAQASDTTDRWGAVLERTPDPTWLDPRSLSYPSYPFRED